MDKTPQKKKWRLNIFDIIIIIAALAIAFAVINYSGAGEKIVSSGTQTTVRYTIELTGMIGQTAYTIKPGDNLTDKVERRAMGTVKSVEVTDFTPFVLNSYTGEQYMAEYTDDRKTAIVVVESAATETESELSINGYIVRVGTEVSVLGPLYAGHGYVIDIERGDA